MRRDFLSLPIVAMRRKKRRNRFRSEKPVIPGPCAYLLHMGEFGPNSKHILCGAK